MNICTESFNSTNSLLKLNIFNSFLHKSHSPSVSSSSTRVCAHVSGSFEIYNICINT